MGTHPIFESDFDCLTERSEMCGDPRTACFYTSIVEIVDGFIGFCVACSALKFQEKFNDAIDSYTDYGHAIDNSSPINVASVGAFFFFVAIVTGAMGVHGYRSRNRWFFLLHILFALLIVVCFFAFSFIHLSNSTKCTAMSKRRKKSTMNTTLHSIKPKQQTNTNSRNWRPPSPMRSSSVSSSPSFSTLSTWPYSRAAPCSRGDHGSN